MQVQTLSWLFSFSLYIFFLFRFVFHICTCLFGLFPFILTAGPKQPCEIFVINYVFLVIGHFIVVGFVPQPASEYEVDLVLIQNSFALLWKFSLKNTSQHKNNLIYMIKQEGWLLYQNKVNSNLAFNYNRKMAYLLYLVMLLESRKGRGSCSWFKIQCQFVGSTH